MKTLEPQAAYHVRIWLSILCCLVALIVIIGGTTRLTGSGLSMVDWQLLLGSIPPLNDAQWMKTFERYQQFPQFKHAPHMNLADFKAIFFWEYLHRMLGRLIGVAFLIPFAVFCVKKKLNARWIKKLVIGFCLLLSQGLLGWYMVQSGLVDIPRVSQYRLASHLFLAFVFFAYLLWLALDAHREQYGATHNTDVTLQRSSIFVALLVLLQILVGAFVAGTHAGLGYNTFPKMGETWIPDGLLRLSPAWLNFFENTATIQFTHRIFAYLVCAAVLYFWILSRRSSVPAAIKTAATASLVMVGIQFILGVSTLLLKVPLSLAVAHQFGALLLFATTIVVAHRCSSHSSPQRD